MFLSSEIGLENYGWFILQTIILHIVIAAAAWFIVRFFPARFNKIAKSSRIKIVERVVLEPKRSLFLVEFDGSTVLLGTTENSMKIIKHLPNDCSDSQGHKVKNSSNE